MNKLFFIFLIFCVSFKAFSQNENLLKTEYKHAEKLSEKGLYKEALASYKKLLAQNSESGHFNFKVGYTFYLLANDSAEMYLEKAADKVSKDFTNEYNDHTAPLETWFYLGIEYHANYKFEKALQTFENLSLFIQESPMKNEVDAKIKECKYGLSQLKQPVQIEVLELGGGVNSTYADHSPVFSGNMRTLIFTSRRKGVSDKKLPDGEYSEDIFVSSYDNKGNWSNAVNISNNINTPEHEASIGLSIDGKQLLIYKSDNNGDIFLSELKKGVWTIPVALGKNINTRERETHASLSVSGNELYFISSRKGGYGGTDIYVSRKQKDGTWGVAENLGPNINTSKNEEGSFIHADDSTLFFSSKGHQGMGKFDLFVSMKNSLGGWFPPTNIGYPINSSDDDLFLSISPSGKFAFYSSNQKGTIGNTNIYTIRLPEAYSRNISTVSGNLFAEKKSETKINEMKVLIIDPITTDTIRNMPVEPEDGDFLTAVPSNTDYIISYSASNQLPIIETINTNMHNTNDLNINLQPITLGLANQTYDVQYENEKDKLSYQTTFIINTVSKLIIDNNALKTEIIIHDNDPNKDLVVQSIINQFKSNNVNIADISLNYEKNNLSFQITLVDSVFDNIQKKEWNTEFDTQTNQLEVVSKHNLKEMIQFMKNNKDVYVEIPYNETINTENTHQLFEYLISQGIDSSQIRANVSERFDPNDFNLTLGYKQTNNCLLSDLIFEKTTNKQTVTHSENSEIYNTLNSNIKYDPCEFLYEKANSIIYSINFEYNKYETSQINGLDSISDCLIINPKIKMQVLGHTDSKGKKEYNSQLGEKRAVYIYNYLLQKGVNPEQLNTTTYGEENPIAPNENSGKDNPQGREQNRRVELKVIKLE